MAVKRLLNIRPQYDDGNGALASNYRLFFYAAGSSTKQNTYSSSTGTVANSNPITLNALGEPAVEIWGTVGQTYKIGLAISGTDDPPASFIWTEDNISPINDTTVSVDQWSAGPAPTFVSTTSFTLVGDQTSTFHVGRRVKSINTAGTVYSTITASVFAALTTVTVVNDSGVLDSGLSAVSYALLSSSNPSLPVLKDTDFLVSGSSDQTKKVRLEVDGVTTGTTRVLTVPDADITLGNWSTGDVKLTLKTTADSGWVLMDDKTIGDASSGGTGRANADTMALFVLLWTNTADADCAVSTGRGGSAAADFAAHKTIALPKTLGRALAAYGAGSGLTTRALAHVVGEETHILTTTEMPSHTHNINYQSLLNGGGTGGDVKGTGSTAATTSTGSDGAHNNMQPTVFLNVMVKL